MPVMLALIRFTFQANDGTADSNVATVSITVTAAALPLPAVVSSRGYINGAPLTAHTTAAFNSVGASTLVAFVSTNSPWNGLPVTISGLSDNAGNTWNVLTGPTTWTGNSLTLVSGIYYVNAPATSGTHTLTVHLTNGAPLVVHVFAISGSDISGPPIYSAITNPAVGGTSANVTTAPITVPANSLLLSWVKNETGATATAISGYSLDAESTSYLWAESQIAVAAGSYTGDFQYDAAIGWQTAILGLKPAGGPTAFNQAVTANHDTPVSITLTASSPSGLPLTYSVLTGPGNGALSGLAPNLTYTPKAGYAGADSFTFKANDGTADSNVATVSVTVTPTTLRPPPSVVSSRGYINTTALTTHTTEAFNSVGASTLVAFVSSHSPWNGLPVSISSLSDNVGNNWNLLTGPTMWTGNSVPMLSAIYYVDLPATSSTHVLTVHLTNGAPLVVHVFAISGSDISGPPIYSAITNPAVGGTSANVTTAPITVPANSLLLSWVKNETGATATATSGYSLDAESTSYLWAESQIAVAAGSYTGDFQYDAAIGWQTAILDLKPAGGPTAFNQTVTANHDTPMSITLTASSPSGLPLTDSVLTGPANGTLSGTAPNLTYTPKAGYAGADSFTFQANDGTADSNVATVSITVTAAALPLPAVVSSRGYINGTPLTAHTTAAFNSVGASTLVASVSTNSPWNGLPVTISGLSDNAGNTWNVLTGPTTWAGNSFTRFRPSIT